jgi:hypothetical protein
MISVQTSVPVGAEAHVSPLRPMYAYMFGIDVEPEPSRTQTHSNTHAHASLQSSPTATAAVVEMEAPARTVDRQPHAMERALFSLSDAGREAHEAPGFTALADWKMGLSQTFAELAEYADRLRIAKRMRKVDEVTRSARWDRMLDILKEHGIKPENVRVDLPNDPHMSVDTAVAVAALLRADIAIRRGLSAAVYRFSRAPHARAPLNLFTLHPRADLKVPRTYRASHEMVGEAELERTCIAVPSIWQRIRPARFYKVADLARILGLLGRTPEQAAESAGKKKATKTDTYNYIVSVLDGTEDAEDAAPN